jgi:putative membrane protein
VKIAALVAIGFVAVAHIYFLVLEMFLWNRPFGHKTFGNTPDFARASAPLAANQGLYNGFLAAGLAWALYLGLPEGRAIATFFLGCVAVAGIFGALTAKPVILFLQTLPAAIALGLVWFS